MGLAFVAGSVDAAGYVLHGSIFTANMAGNTVLLGIHLAREDWNAVLRSLEPVPLFTLGAFLAATFLAEAGRRRCRAFWVIGAQLSGGQGRAQDPTGGGWLHCALVACLSVAMGLQSASLRHVAGEMARTTPVTGALLGSADALARALRRHRKREAGKAARKAPHPAVFAAMWVSYLLGALAAALCQDSLGFGTIVLALAVLGGFIILELPRIARGARSG